MLLDHLLRQLIMAVQQAPPGVVTRFGGRARRVDYVGEQYRRQNAFEFGRGTLARAGHELLDVAEHRFHIAIPEGVTGGGVFDNLGARNLPRQPTPFCSTGTSPSFRRCSTSVGTRTLASIDRTSISAFICITAFTAPGLAASRSNLANNATASGFAARLGMRALMPAPVPQCCTRCRILSSISPA